MGMSPDETRQYSTHQLSAPRLARVFFYLVPNNQVASVLMRKTLFGLSVYEKIEGVYVTEKALLQCLHIRSCKT